MPKSVHGCETDERSDTMRLIELLNGLEYECIQGPLDREVSAVINDSRKVTADSLFLCIKGAKFDGHEYVADVVKQGAAVLVVSEEVHVEEKDRTVTIIRVADTRYAMAFISAAWFGHPAEKRKK